MPDLSVGLLVYLYLEEFRSNFYETTRYSNSNVLDAQTGMEI